MNDDLRNFIGVLALIMSVAFWALVVTWFVIYVIKTTSKRKKLLDEWLRRRKL